MNQIVTGCILLNKPNLGQRGLPKKLKMVQEGFKPQSPAWLPAMLPVKHIRTQQFSSY